MEAAEERGIPLLEVRVTPEAIEMIAVFADEQAKILASWCS